MLLSLDKNAVVDACLWLLVLVAYFMLLLFHHFVHFQDFSFCLHMCGLKYTGKDVCDLEIFLGFFVEFILVCLFV